MSHVHYNGKKHFCRPILLMRRKVLSKTVVTALKSNRNHLKIHLQLSLATDRLAFVAIDNFVPFPSVLSTSYESS